MNAADIFAAVIVAILAAFIWPPVIAAFLLFPN